MNEWSRRRKRIVLAIVTLALLVLVGLPALFLFYKAPSCSDGRQNGDEAGIDCGGSCQLLCKAESLPLILKGDPRILSVSTTTYQVVALVENANTDAEIYQAGYTLKLYGASSGAIPIKIIEGEAFVPKGSVFSIFEGPITIEESGLPTRAVLEWDQGSLVWQKEVRTYPKLEVKDIKLSREETAPRLEAVVQNLSLENVANIDLTAVLSDASGNIFAASKTFIDALAAGSESPIVFTWPRPFGQEVAGTDIIIRIFPDRSFIK
jgi:hypothetical protein